MAVRVAGMIVMVMVVVARVMVMGGVLIGLNIEPRTRIRLRVDGVEPPRGEQPGDRHGGPIDEGANCPELGQET